MKIFALDFKTNESGVKKIIVFAEYEKDAKDQCRLISRGLFGFFEDKTEKWISDSLCTLVGEAINGTKTGILAVERARN